MSDPGIVIPIVSLVAIAAVAALGRRVGTRSARADTRISDASMAKLDERISRLEQAIDVIAVEMERVGEGQRFLTKVLVEREAKEG